MPEPRVPHAAATCAAGRRAPTLGEIIKEFDVRFVGAERFAWEVAKWRRERPRLTQVYAELESFIYDLAYPKVFDTSTVEAALDRPVVREDPLASLLAHDSAVLDRGHLQVSGR
jgi:hypothetical protein